MICSSPSAIPAPVGPEVPVIGRSNVGKSSLINALLGVKLIKVSQQPGRTREVIFLNAGPDGFVVDLPGYGFAKVPKEMRESWGRLVEGYLKRQAPGLGLLLLDIRREVPAGGDVQMVAWFRHYGRPFEVVLTKADKVARGKRAGAQRAIVRALGLGDEEVPLAVSAQTGEGIDELRKRVARALGRPRDVKRGKEA